MILIGLGSNLGDKAQHLCTACTLLRQAGIRILRRSPLFRTPPWGVTDQDWFLNAVCEVQYSGTPEALLEHLLAIEQQMGRARDRRWGPRIIDLDLLEFHRQQRQTAPLTLPHPRYPERAFVLAPLASLAPAWIPTGHHLTVSQLLENQAAAEVYPVPAPPCWEVE